MTTIAPLILTLRYQREIVRAFRQKRAISGAAARRLRDLGIRDSEVFRQLITSAVVRKAGPERYFLHEPTWAARTHLAWPLIALIAILTVGAAAGAAAYFAP